MNDDTAIKVDSVYKSFKLPHEKNSSIKGALINFKKGSHKGYEKQEVLRNISFEIKKGEFFGIVGRNGSGKSTLLYIVGALDRPSSGSITLDGTDPYALDERKHTRKKMGSLAAPLGPFGPLLRRRLAAVVHQLYVRVCVFYCCDAPAY